MSQAHYIGRFAPSPTGPLHFGSLLAALASYLDARANRGTWLVRIEDIDETRCDVVHVSQILTTLRAFGLNWDGDVAVQSQRKPCYDKALNALHLAERIYACECSRREIADSAIAGIDGPVYPGTCRTKRLPIFNSPSPTALRFMVGSTAGKFTDRLQGPLAQRLDVAVGDFVVKRRDGLTAYQLAVVVDDFDAGVTHVVRGADLIDSTARQIALQAALGYRTPSYLHIPVATNDAGEKLSKQTLATPLTVENASDTLRAALRFLNQPVGPSTAPVAVLLADAVAGWRPGTIPRRLSLPVQQVAN